MALNLPPTRSRPVKASTNSITESTTRIERVVRLVLNTDSVSHVYAGHPPQGDGLAGASARVKLARSAVLKNLPCQNSSRPRGNSFIHLVQRSAWTGARMMAVALALVRCGPSRHASPRCLLAVGRRARSASGAASSSTQSKDCVYVRHHHLFATMRGRGGRGAVGCNTGSNTPMTQKLRTFATNGTDGVAVPKPGDVHLWLFDPADADDELLRLYERDVLSSDDRLSLSNNASSQMTPGARAQVVRSQALMRCVLARYCGHDVSPSSLRFSVGEKGKPRLAGFGESGSDDDAASTKTKPSLRFSLSHTNKLLALAVTSAPPEGDTGDTKDSNEVDTGDNTGDIKGDEETTSTQRPFAGAYEVGVDCEDSARRTSAVTDRLAKRWLSEHEAQVVGSIPSETERASFFMKTWVLKEAYVKALGTGIAAHPFFSFDVKLEPKSDGGGVGAITLVERTGLREVANEGETTRGGGVGSIPDDSSISSQSWRDSASRWRFALLRIGNGKNGNLICATCVWDARGMGQQSELSEQTPPGLEVRWTLPMRGDFEKGEKPEPEVLAASHGAGAD